MGDRLNQNFVKVYNDKQYKHTAMVNHRGTIVAFAMDQNRNIYYTVLDLSTEDQNKGPLDVKYWMTNPQQLFFPNEIEQVGYGVITPAQLPIVTKNNRQEVNPDNVTANQVDPFLSTTARLTENAPFQVFSDNQHIYVFRQSIGNNHTDMLYKLKTGGFSGTAADTAYLKDAANQKVPIASNTLLVDRYVLSGTTLNLPQESRFRRSRNKTTPASAKDSLGSKDMEGNPFYEPTKELDFVRNLSQGRFSVVMLPTEVADIERWQIFAYNQATQLIDSFNIERADDGYFNTQGTQLYTSPAPQYQPSVLERKPGTCPFTGLDLIPIVSKSGYAESALEFDGSSTYVNLGNPNELKITGNQTIELWIKPKSLSKRQNPFDKAYGGEGAITLETNGTLHYFYGTTGRARSPFQSINSVAQVSTGVWTHIAVVRDLVNMKLHWYINGVQTKTVDATYSAATASNSPIYIGKGYAGFFDGAIDEVRVWNRARSNSEILDTMNHRLLGDELGLVGYWRLDEGSGTQIKGQTSNRSHGTVHGTATWVASAAPIGDNPGMRRTSFSFADRQVNTGLAAKLYYEQEKTSNVAGAKSIKQNAKVLLTAVTNGVDPNVPIADGLVLYLCGESYRGGERWDDLSGRGYHATKAGGNMPALHQVTNYNGKDFPVMRFGTDDGMAISDNLSLAKPFTVMIIDRYTGGARGRTLQSRENNWLLGKWMGKNGCFMQGWIGGNNAPYAATDNVFTISTATLEDTSSHWYVDGVLKGSSGGSTAPGKLGLCKGGKYVTREESDADIACVLIWDRVLSTTERQTVEKWLGAKYGIAVGHSVDLAAIARKYIAAIDVGVSREGKLAQIPDTISLPVLLSSDPGGGASNALLTEMTGLETDIATLNKEIVTLNWEISTLDGEITPLEADIAAIPSVEAEIEIRNSIVIGTHPDYPPGTVSQEMIQSIKYRLSLAHSRLTDLKNKRDNILPPKKTEITQKRALLTTKQGQLTTKTTKLTELKRIQGGEVPPLPMQLLHTDPQGLTVSSGLLAFAYTDSEPFLFDSALGRMALYFRGLKDQFFSAYYDVNVARAEWSLPAATGSLKLTSRISETVVNNTTLTIADGGDTNHCTATIQNSLTGLTETWNNLPRDVQMFSHVLNGGAANQIFVGKLSADLTGPVTTVDLITGLPQQVPVGATLLVGNHKLTVSATAPSGAKQITVSSASVTAKANTSIDLLLYDYTTQAISNRTGYSLHNGSLQINSVPGQAKGQISNGTASLDVQARSPQWVADAPGSTLAFDGQDDYLYNPTPDNFKHDGNITMEAWVCPAEGVRESSLICCQTPGSSYLLGLGWGDLETAMSMDGAGDYIQLPSASTLGLTNHDFTVEAWVYITVGTNTDLPILGGTTGQNNQGLHLMIRNKKPYMGFYTNDLADPTVLTEYTWYHLAFRYTAATKEQAIFVNGNLTSRRTASAHYQGTDQVRIGSAFSSYFQGKLDEVRIWNTARTAEEIKTYFSRRLSGAEPGLTGFYYFENDKASNRTGNVNDRSGHGHHGTLHGNLINRGGSNAPFAEYSFRAVVGNEGIESKMSLVTDDWHHIATVYNQSYALNFQIDNYADAGNESMLNITEDLTIEAFLRLDSVGRKHGILSKGIMYNGDGGTVPYAFFVDESGKLVLSFESEDGINQTFSSSASLSPNQFYRVAVVRRLGQEKVEKTGTQSVTYTDENGQTQTQTFNTIESVDFKDYNDIRFYIDGVESGLSRYNGKKPGGNRGALYLGRSYIYGQQFAQFQGIISEIRVWNVARNASDIGRRHLLGTENGLTGWWRFEENSGNIAYDSKSSNHARIWGAQWVKTPDPNGSSFVMYVDGVSAATKSLAFTPTGDTQFTVGARKQGGTYQEYYKGKLEEVRIWKTARRHEEILDNLFTRLKGEQELLIANYSFDGSYATDVKDLGLKSNHLTIPASPHKPGQVLSTAPISNDTAQVRSALAGVKTNFQDRITGRPAVAEYADAQRLADGRLMGIYKRSYTYAKNGQWLLLTGYKVGNLVTEWIGQAQFDPQVVGYIEGAPPVPSENLTEGFTSTARTFNGTSEVSLQESESVNYSISSSKESSFASSFELEASMGVNFDPRIILAPLGIGISKKTKFSLASKQKLTMEANGSWSGGETFGSGQNVSTKMSAAIGGNWDVPDPAKWANPELTRRFIPANMGFALVESETADIYALRLAHNGALVAFRILPNPDIPKDTNIIPFPINAQYTKQGTLDGRLGYTQTGVALDPAYANATGYGEYSYFKPKEAYELKKRIEREEQRLKDFYNNFNTTPAGARLMGTLAGAFTGGVGGSAALGSAIAAKFMGASLAGAAGPIVSGAMIAGGMGTTIGSLIDAATQGDPQLAGKYARRNLVNTYVWTADGGFYEESTQISEVHSESKSGKYAFTGKFNGGFALEVDAGLKNNFGLTGMLGGSLNLTKSKEQTATKSFGVNMKLAVPDNLQQYTYKTPGDPTSGVKPMYDGNGNPIMQPGKVDAYRFMTFYLEPQLNNFEDLFGKVVDPIWLRESQHPNAVALRQANQANKKPKCWRIFHRVTFVSRILPDFPSTTQPPLEKKMKDLNITSNYELVRRLDPFVRDSTKDFIEFKDAVRLAVQAYLPELSAENDLSQITLFLADYYGVER